MNRYYHLPPSVKHLLIAAWLTGLLAMLLHPLLTSRQQQAELLDELTRLAEQKEILLDQWITAMEVDLLRLSRFPIPGPRLQEGSSWLRLHFDELTESYLAPFGHFLEVFVMDERGQVILSTDPDAQGRYKHSRRYFLQGRHTAYIQPAHHSISLGTVAITLARPLTLIEVPGHQTYWAGVLAARADLTHLQQLMQTANQPASQLPRTYLVNRYGFFITPPESFSGSLAPYPRTAVSEGIEACLKGQPLQGRYLNHDQQAVIGTGLWLPRHQLCLMAEQPAAGLEFRSPFLLWLFVSLLAATLLVLAVGWLYRPVSNDTAHHEPDCRPAEPDRNFLRLLGHEIRTPLNGIIGMLSLLQEGRLTEEQRHQIRVADTSAQQLYNLMTQMMVMTQDEKEDHQSVEKHWINLQERLSLLTESYHWKARQKGLFLRFQADEASDQLVYLADTLLIQLLGNLLENAFKFTEKGGVTLELQIRQGQDQQQDIIIRVRDTGQGIPLQEQQRIFQPFHKIIYPGRKPDDSLGLGLAICQRLARQLKAALELESSPGKGSCFTILLSCPGRKA
ncbi:sensor histidine kinase [Marinospirillum alkaliphilum]|uniref:histidine kinase n=1 Tax=Marinospirillum alkaliphilum DSM 21637 TaxID=1122209 RepID=A0A1K1XPL7_9GAMM|nr:ATP-binding protein [Marinospirillum alkaliphilum]SFX51013.1 His Kinase A (phospho-acceptor) domain-containing protein [Marinospirillum alkaliphilum DSM 21637]